MKASTVGNSGGKWLKSSDVEKPAIVTISGATEEELQNLEGKKDNRIALSFEEDLPGLILNQTNKFFLIDAYGDETDDWIGKKIVIYVANIPYQGKMVSGLRVRLPKGTVVQRHDDEDAPY